MLGLSDQLDVKEERQGVITNNSQVSCLNNQVDDGAKDRDDGRRFSEGNKNWVLDMFM